MSGYRLNTCPAMAELLQVADDFVAAMASGDTAAMAALSGQSAILDQEITQRQAIYDAGQAHG